MTTFTNQPQQQSWNQGPSTYVPAPHQPQAFGPSPVLNMMNAVQPIQPAGAPMPGPAPVQPPPVPNQLPTIHLPDQAVVNAAMARAQHEAEKAAQQRAGGGGGQLRKWSPPGPDGNMKWGNNVPVGYSSSNTIYLCSSAQPGVLPFQEAATHFYKSQQAPNGVSVPCLGGYKTCPVCAARGEMFRTSNAADVERAKANGKSRKQFWYNIIWLDQPASHVDGTKWVPWLFAASTTVQDGLNEIFQMYGMQAVVNPAMMRPLRITKKKSGPRDMDIEWSVHAMDATPLPPQFYGPLYNLNDLTKRVEAPTREGMIAAIQGMQFPFTAEVQQLLATLPSSQAPQQPQQQAWSPQQGGQPQDLPPPQQPQWAPPGAPGTQGQTMGGPPPPQQMPQWQNTAPQGPPQQPQWSPGPPGPPPQQFQQPMQGPPPYAPPAAPQWQNPNMPNMITQMSR